MARDPTQAEVDSVADAIDTARENGLKSKGQVRAAIQALDKLRGPCVPVDALKAKLEQSHEESVFGRTDRLMVWLDRKGWLDK